MTSTRASKRTRNETTVAGPPSPGDVDSEPQAKRRVPNPGDDSSQHPSTQTASEDPLPRRYATRPSTREARPGVKAGLAKRLKSDIQAKAAEKRRDENEKQEKKEKRKQEKAARESEGAKKAAALQDERAQRELEEMEEMERSPVSDEEIARAANRQDSIDPDALDESSVTSNSDDEDKEPASKKFVYTERTGRNAVAQPEDDEELDVQEVAPPAKKRTESERRAQRVTGIRGQIASQRALPLATKLTRGETGGAPSARETPSLTPKPKAKGLQGDAFTADYRQRSRSTPGTPAAAAQATQHIRANLTFLDNAPASRHLLMGQNDWLATTFNFIDSPSGSSASFSAPIQLQPEQSPLSDEEIAGLDDEDAVTPMPKRAQKQRMRPVHGQAKNTMVRVLPDTLIKGDEAVDTPTKPSRAPRKQVPLAKSRAFNSLPDWIHDTVGSVIIPSFIKYYGSCDDPWDIDGKSGNEFTSVLNALLKRLHPGHENTITKTDKTWRYIRQGIYDWRSNLVKQAMRLVAKAADKKGTPSAIKEWATDALAKGGEATYRHPNTEIPSAARGALQTQLFIQLLAAHYDATEGAIIETSYPVGALTLASVAIRRAYTAWKTGRFVAQEDFKEGKYGQGTKQVRDGAVAGLIKMPHRFDELVTTALAQLPSYRRAEAEATQEAEDDAEAYAAVDPPTSPPHADQY
ncbi:hypothetical protein L227DRAFT_610493 [Lentinus tigrinus ALCF2SS1-6]|uniref:Uncharacterized protein n=1 Tax=Lentinus tigrinus ALCF2SS1-6 TaxID=1328759 RepID=A0A5C2SE78_9APHY|nr:hypothetical protein L227DRAFT_610493 [Lentinus tigrinus ALCF2SS1-6]